MRKKTFISFIALALMAAACSSGPQDAPDLLRTVPSRSIEVMYFRHAGNALEMLLDSAHVFRRLDLGRLENAEMVLSYDYSSALVPLLSLDAGRFRTDTSEAVKAVIGQAADLRLQTAYVADTVRRNVSLLISPSTASIAEALIHIQAGTSILDSEDFTEAFRQNNGSEGFIMIRHSAGGTFLPKDFLSGGEVRRGVLSRFIREAARWTVMSFDSCNPETIDVKFSPEGPARYYMSIFSSQKAAVPKAGKILPEGTDWVVDIPLGDWESFYSSRSLWLDATSRLKRHQWGCEDLGKEYGISPLDWCRRICPQEIAAIRWEGRSVVAVRCRRTPSESDFAPLATYAGEVFGNTFKEQVEGGSFSVFGKWLVAGSGEDLAAFNESEKTVMPKVFGKKAKYIIWRPEWSLVQDERGARINIVGK